MRLRNFALSCLVGFVWAGAAVAQIAAATPGAGAATRDVAQYLNLERALQDALARHDRAAVLASLAQDFAVRASPNVDNADASAWLQLEFAASTDARLPRDLSVRKVNGLAVVSFYLQEAKPTARPRATAFVVDLWREADTKLLARISSPARGLRPMSVRPSGRD